MVKICNHSPKFLSRSLSLKRRQQFFNDTIFWLFDYADLSETAVIDQGRTNKHSATSHDFRAWRCRLNFTIFDLFLIDRLYQGFRNRLTQGLGNRPAQQALGLALHISEVWAVLPYFFKNSATSHDLRALRCRLNFTIFDLFLIDRLYRGLRNRLGKQALGLALFLKSGQF